MKYLLTGLCLALCLAACDEYEPLDNCIDVSTVDITFNNTPCPSPPDTCLRTFSLSQFNLITSAQLNWEVIDPNGNTIPITDPAAPSIAVSFNQGGTHRIAVQVRFDFDGCDFSRDTTFTVGVDPPRAVIQASATSCDVEDCELFFWQENANADSWTWIFPDGDTLSNQDTVYYNFNQAPGTYQICLEACSDLGGCDPACVNITVDPKTFTLSDDDGLGLEKIIYIKEKSDGSFRAIGANENETFTIDITRGGELDHASLVRLGGLESVYDEFSADACWPLGNNFFAFGTGRRGQNIDMYVASFNANLVPNTEETLSQTNTGSETPNGLTSRIGGGIVVCGSASGGDDAGMVFFGADASLELVEGTTHFGPSALDEAKDILNMGSHYLVVARARNPDNGNQIEGLYFELDENLGMVPSSVNYLGSDYTPVHLFNSNAGVFLVAEKGAATSIIRPLPFGMNDPEPDFANTTFAQSIVISGNRLAVVGYNGSDNRKPLLQILSLPDLQVLNTVNQPYPVDNAEFFCVSETADGGFVMGGKINIGGEDQILILRTNNEGEL